MARRQSSFQYGSTGMPGLALPDASLPQDTAAAAGFFQDKQPSHGNQDLDNQMYFQSIGNYQLHGSSSQGYSTDIDLINAQQRDEEGDPLALGPNPLQQYQIGGTSDIITDNVSGYHPVLTPPWNPVIAAQASEGPSQQKHMNQTFLSPEKRRAQSFSESGYVSESVRSGRSGSFGQRPLDPQATPRSIPALQLLSISDHSLCADMEFNSLQGNPTSVSETGSVSGSFHCPLVDCTWRGKTPSDLKKHAARHKLDHVCTMGDCNRRDKGFATINDLQRHQRTVHRKLGKDDRLFKCFGKSCGHPNKMWPRKDNFISHLKKLHANENIDELLKKAITSWDTGQNHMPPASQSTFDQQTLPPTSYSGRYHNAETQFSSSPTNSNPQQSLGSGYATQMPTSTFLLDDGSIDNMIPGTPSYEDQSQYNQRARSLATLGYTTHLSHQQTHHSANALSHSGQFQPPQINHNSRRFRTQGQLGNASGYQPGQARSTSQHRLQSFPQISLSQVANTSSSMNRSISGGVYDGITPTQYQQTVHHPGTRTVADPLLSLEPDRLGINQQNSLQSPVAFDEQNQPNVGDFYGIALWNTEIPEASTDTVPTIVVHPETEQSNDHRTTAPSLENVRRFLNNYKRRLEDKGGNVVEFRTLLESMSKSVSDTTNADSTDIPPSIHVRADSYIQNTTDAEGKGGFRCGHPSCRGSKVWERRSEIKKHIKRHTKPYGCTFDLCYKNFGAKSDWIRHEVKKHHQPESWLCEFKSPQDQHPCRTLHATRNSFRRHLQEHGITNPIEVNRQTAEQHINTNFQPHFWCGFCERIQVLKQKGFTGVHERYDHITVHLIDEDRCIDEWIPADSTRSKGQIRKEESRPKTGGSQEAEDDDDQSPPSDTASTPPPSKRQMMNRKRTQSQPHPHQHQTHQHQQARNRATLGPGSMQQILGRRKASEAGFNDFDAQPAPSATPTEQVLTQAKYWTCCQCNEDNLLATSPACSGSMQCSHVRCQSCSYYRRKLRGETGLGLTCPDDERLV